MTLHYVGRKFFRQILVLCRMFCGDLGLAMVCSGVFGDTRRIFLAPSRAVMAKHKQKLFF